ASHRQVDPKSAPLALARLDADAAFHPPDELSRDVETQPGPADAARELRIEAIELLEDPPVLRHGDTEPLVADGEANERVVACDAEPERAAVRRVLDRVVEQVGEDLAHLVGVG